MLCIITMNVPLVTLIKLKYTSDGGTRIELLVNAWNGCLSNDSERSCCSTALRDDMDDLDCSDKHVWGCRDDDEEDLNDRERPEGFGRPRTSFTP